MSATDKLHKLYSSTSRPIVWARSVGLEVVNELDSLKAGIMVTAGGKGRRTTQGAAWELAGKTVEHVSAGLNAAQVVGKGLYGSVLQRLQSSGK